MTIDEFVKEYGALYNEAKTSRMRAHLEVMLEAAKDEGYADGKFVWEER